MRTSEQDKTWIVQLLRDMLLAHQIKGRDLEDVIEHLDRVIARRSQGAQ